MMVRREANRSPHTCASPQYTMHQNTPCTIALSKLPCCCRQGGTDFVVFGIVEVSEENASLKAMTESLLDSQHNPRRTLVSKVQINSNNARCTDFVMSSGCDIMCSKELVDLEAAWLEAIAGRNISTDFVVYGETEFDDGQIGLDTARHSLLSSAHNPRRALCCPVVLPSNNRRCTDFVLHSSEGLLCSKVLTSSDVIWLEQKLRVKPGTLFKAARRANGTPSTTELPWDPMERYKALARTLRKARGAKSAAHMENLRQSDPTIRLQGWLDWRELYDRAATAAAAKYADSAESAAVAALPRKDSPRQEGMVLPKTGREERVSANSVIDLLELAPTDKCGPEPWSPASVLDTAGPSMDEPWSLEGKLGGAKAANGATGRGHKGKAQEDKGIGRECEVLWFDGQAYIKSDTLGGYSSS